VIRAQLLMKWLRIVAQFEFSLSLKHLFSVISENIIVNHTMLKSTFLGYLLSQRVWPNFTHCDVVGPQSYRIGEITQNNGHYAAQGH